MKNPVVTMGCGGFRVEGERDPTVRVPNPYLKCVSFIGEAASEDSAGIHGELCATGFFVSVPFPSEHLPQRAFYFVTAAHVAKELSDKPIYFLVNKKGGGVTGISNLLDSQWWLHPTDRTTDVAVLPVGFEKDADIAAIALVDFVGADDFSSQAVGVGDEVFITGLFTGVTSEDRLAPIVRQGNVAMLPDEQIQTDLGYADVHLIEARSIGGLSGSPVFVRPSVTIEVDSQSGPARLDASSRPKLFGLTHGHWAIRESDINKPQIDHDRQRGVNYGVAIVVPAAKIREIIKRPELEELRQLQEDLLKKRSIPGMDSAKADKQPPVLTKEDFEAALKKASRKIEPGNK